MTLNSNIKLYGIALAAVTNRKDPSVMNVICTPVSVTDKKRREFKCEEGAFKCSIDLANPAEMLRTFIKTVDLIESVVALQEASLKAHKLPYRRVALDIGEDGRKPVHPNFLFTAIFDAKLASRTVPLKERWDTYRQNARKNVDTLQKFFRAETSGLWARGVSEVKSIYIGHYAAFMNQVHGKMGERLGEFFVKKMHEVRLSYLFNNREQGATFIRACEKLARLIEDKCTLKWGSYNTKPNPEIDGRMEKLTVRLRELKAPFYAGDPEARAEMMRLAKEEGVASAGDVNKNSNIFAILMTPPGYWQDPAMQEKEPIYCFYNWDPAFKDAFYEGYYGALDIPRFRHVKLPTDPPNAPFSDPCADMICEQFEIIEGSRRPKRVADAKHWRKAIGEAARKNVELLHDAYERLPE